MASGFSFLRPWSPMRSTACASLLCVVSFARRSSLSGCERSASSGVSSTATSIASSLTRYTTPEHGGFPGAVRVAAAGTLGRADRDDVVGVSLCGGSGGGAGVGRFESSS